MRYTKFRIRNFKGIQDLEFNMDAKCPVSKVLTLVGLNESGKTTILEALSFFYENIKKEKHLTITRSIFEDIHDLIPKSKKGFFNDDIVVDAWVELDVADKEDIQNFMLPHGFVVSNIAMQITMSVIVEFKDSTFKKKRRTWSSEFVSGGRSQSGKKGPRPNKSLFDEYNELWIKLVNHTADVLLPAIIYYPNFLFDFPDQIFLEERDNESKEQIFYRKVLQDILSSIDKDLSLKTHVIKRLYDGKPNDLDSVEAIVNKMSGQITRFLSRSKMDVFSKLLENKSVIIKYPKSDVVKGVYIEMKLKSGDDEYFVRERSLGFRWFLTYLLFTQFRTFRVGSKNLIFLFDEPASNLHQTGQQRLLSAFFELTKNANASVIYSTHSHHLINPQWLETTYIVKNNSIDYDAESEDYSQATDVSIIRYRTFVSRNPSQINYFQPILDVLDYKPNNLENIPNVVMLEGKNDFYSLEYLNKVIGVGPKLNFVPGMGSGKLDAAIQLYYSWGRNFIVLLDSDEAGLKEKKRYVDKFGSIVRDKIFTLEDVNAKWKNKDMEDIFEGSDSLDIQKTIYPDILKVDKTKLNLSIQELLVNSKSTKLSTQSKENFESIFNFFSGKLAIKD
jgi:energy-coupling factor transporter ATP-binding protein EcfA2